MAYSRDKKNALLQSICFTTDATELGFSGAMELPFEALASLWWWEGRGPPSKHCADKINALLQSLCFRTDAIELGVEWCTAEIRNALLQSVCFKTDATELGFLGAVRLPFEELAPCDGGRGGARHQSIVLTKSTHCYRACASGPMLLSSVLNGARPK